MVYYTLSYKRLTSTFLIISLVFVLFNNTYFLHTHTFPDGRVIEHAHPYNHNNHDDDSLPLHKHSKSEYIFLHFIFNLFTYALILIFILLIKLSKIKGKLFFSFISFYLQVFHYNYSLRAPPEASLL